jgi:hypothetical protein
VTGQEQRAIVVPVPASLVEAAQAQSVFAITPGTFRAISIDGERPIAFFDAPPPDGSPPSFEVGVFESRTADGELRVRPLPVPIFSDTGAPASVWRADDWPTPGQQVYAWPHLPSATAFVTYEFDGVRRWQRPVWNTAAFVVPRPPRFVVPLTEDVSDAPPQVFRAYDARGELLAETTYPSSQQETGPTTTTTTPPST